MATKKTPTKTKSKNKEITDSPFIYHNEIKTWDSEALSFPVGKSKKPTVEKVKVRDTADTMLADFREYSSEIIRARAFPSALDGFINVQRRALYQGFNKGYLPTKPFVKANEFVASVMVLHPHGDSSIYSSIVNLAVNWTRAPHIDFYSGLGASYGQDPAQSRYTKCRLSNYGWMMVEDLKNKAVEMVTDEDHETVEPIFLPTKFPNLLINGAQGLGIGYRVFVPQHNPIEVMRAVEELISNPKMTVDDIMEIMPAPDFATGGQVFPLNEKGENTVRDYYEKGTGSFIVVSTPKIENGNIHVDAMPYGVNIEKIIEDINKAIISGKIDSLEGAINKTSDDGAKLLIEVKPGVSPQEALDTLMASGLLHRKIDVFCQALDSNIVLRRMGVKEVLEEFIKSRYIILKNVLTNEVEKAEARKHLLEGMSKVVLDIDKAIKIIRGSENSDKAKAGLMKSFKIDEEQANHVLSITLRRLTKQDRYELEKEISVLDKLIKEDKAILNSKIKQRNTIKKQAQEMRELFEKDPRCQRITSISKRKFKKKNPKEFITKSLGEGKWGIDRNGYLSDKGDPIDGKNSFAVTKEGRVKVFGGKGLPAKYSAPVPIIPDPTGIVSAGLVEDDKFIAMVTKFGKVLKFDPSKVNAQGIAGTGTTGMKLSAGDEIIGAVCVDDKDSILTISNQGWKATKVSAISVKGLRGMGMAIQNMRKGEEITEISSGENFIVNNKKIPNSTRTKSSTKGSVTSWRLSE